MIKPVVIALIGLLMCSHLAMSADSPVGSIKSIENTATIKRHETIVPAQEGGMIFVGDILMTDKTGTIGVIFRDDAMISLGPDSQVKIDAFMFRPAEGQFSFIARMIRGTAAFVSGQIAKLSPESMRVQTPVAEIGVRGTRFAVQAEGE